MTYPLRVAGTVTLDGVDITDYVDPNRPITIQNVLTRKADTCKLYLERASDITPAAWQELVVLDGADRIFAGYVTDIDQGDGADLDIDYSLTAADYSIRMEKVYVKEEYVNMTDAAILAALFTKYLAGEGYDAVTNVHAIRTHARLRFNRKTLLECIIQLAELSKADFYVDYDKKLHFFETDTGAATAPFALSDNPDLTSSMPYGGMDINRDGSGVVNRVEVLGGNYRSEDTTFYLPGTGQDNRILLPFRLHAPDGESTILVYRNDGTQVSPVWTPMTIKVGYIDELSDPDEVLYYYQEKVIEQSANWPELPNAVKIEAKYEVPLRTRVSDDASILHYGLVLDGLIVDENITDKTTARLAALAKLTQSSMETTAIALETRQPGLRAGQIVTLVNSIHSINGNYLVQRVVTSIGVAGSAIHKVSLGTYNADLIDLMLTLARQAKPKVSWREDEVLDELLQKAERLALSEGWDEETTTYPYFWSNDPAKNFLWGFGSMDERFFALRDDFTTTASAPLTSPRTCEPGPGTITIVDTGNRLSISSGKLISSGITTSFSVPRFYSPIQTRAAGKVFYARIQVLTLLSALFAGSSATVNATPSLQAFWFPQGFYDRNGSFTSGDSFAYSTWYDCALIMRGSGAFLLLRGGAYTSWTLAWVSDFSASNAHFLFAPGSQGTYEIENIAIFQLYGEWETDYGIATSHAASPTSGTTGTMEADGFVNFTWTPASSQTLDLMVRYTDDNNCWIVRCSQSGSTIKLIQKQAGVETERASTSQTWTPGTAYAIAVRCVTQNIRTFVNAVAKNTFGSASFNQTATGIKVSGFTTGANLATFPRTISGTPLRELLEHLPL